MCLLRVQVIIRERIDTSYPYSIVFSFTYEVYIRHPRITWVILGKLALPRCPKHLKHGHREEGLDCREDVKEVLSPVKVKCLVAALV